MRWVWKVETEAPHTIVAEIPFGSARETVWLDGREVSNVSSFKFRNEHRVPLEDGQTAKVVVSLAWYLMPKCALFVNGREVPPLRGQAIRAAVPKAGKLPGGGIVPPGMPGWGWIFVVSCGAIPLVTLGGALPIIIGLGGAAACAAVAARTSMPVVSRVVICVAIALASWAVLVAVLVLIFGLKQR
jgi:hypothetical protein